MEFTIFTILLDLAIIPLVIWGMTMRADIKELKSLIKQEGDKLSDEHQQHDRILSHAVDKLSDRVIDVQCMVKRITDK